MLVRLTVLAGEVAFLANLVNAGGHKEEAAPQPRTDYRGTYPKGFFDLFGSDPGLMQAQESLSATSNK